jgi:hypothetical protein
MPTSYDLAIAYRIYPKVAKPALAFGDNKLRLSDCCLRSLRDSLRGLRTKIWVLLDGCPAEYEELFHRYFDARHLVLLRFNAIGNLATFGKQIDILLNQKDAELIYFAEDDYLYLPGQFHKMVDFLVSHHDVDFVTPYDHPDCYRLQLHRHPKWMRIFADQHWRTANSTCLTFLTTRATLTKTEKIFRTYERGNRDASLWLSLSKEGILNPATLARYVMEDKWLARITVKAWLYGCRQLLLGTRYRLWVPVPGIATHLDVNGLSPAIDWKQLMQQFELPDPASISQVEDSLMSRN